MISLTQSIVRSIRKPLLIAATLALTAGTVPMTHADSYSPATNQAENAPAGKLSIDQLGQALADYGPNTITNNGQTYYTLNINRGTWKFSLTISLSPNGNVIWMTAPLINVPEIDKASPAALANLLQKNSELGPSFFEIVGTQHKIQLERPIMNREMTAQAVKANVEGLLSTIQKTESLWSKNTVMGAGAAESQPAVSALGIPLR